MSETTYTRRINIYVDSGQALAAQEVLLKKQDAINASIRKYTDNGKEIPEKLTKQLNSVTEALERQSKKISGELSPNLKELAATYQKTNAELSRMEKEDAGFEKKRQETIAAKKALEDYKGSLGTVATGWKDMLKNAGGVALGVLFAGGVQAIAQSVIGAFTSLVKFRNEFEASVKNLSAITGATGADLEYLKNASVELASTGSRSATEYVEAMKLIGSAKPELLQDKEGLVEVTKAANLLAKASGLDLPDAAKRLTDALNQYGAPASEAAKYVDILAASAKYGAAEIPGITDALLEFGPVAKQSNISMEESAAAIELLAEKGVKGAEAGTKLRNVFLALSAVDSLPAGAIEQLKKYGVNTDLLQDKTKSLGERLTELGKISGDANAMMQVFDKQNIVAGQILLENIPRYTALEKSIHETGVASAQASTNVGTLSGAWGKLTNAIQTLALGVGLDWLKGLLSGMGEAVTWFGKLTGVIQSNVVALENERSELLLNEQRITSLNVGNENRTKLIQELQNKYPAYLANLDAEKATNEEISAAIAKVNNSLLTKIALAQVEERLSDAAKDRSKAELSLADAQLAMEKEIAYLLNSRSAAANKYNKDQLEGMSTSQKAAYLLSGTVKLQEVANSSLADLSEATTTYNAKLNKKNEAVDEYNKILEDQLKTESLLKQQLGISETGGAPSTSTASASGGASEADKKAAKEKEDAAKKYYEDIQKLREQNYLNSLDGFNKEIAAIRLHYARIKEEVTNNTKLTAKEREDILKQYSALEGAEIEAATQKYADELTKQSEKLLEHSKSHIELSSKTQATVTEITLTELEKQKLAYEAFQKSLEQNSKGVISIAQNSLNFINTIFDGMKQQEDAELARDARVNNKKKENLKNQLNSKKLTQKAYEQAVSEMEKAQDVKRAEIAKKQFERNKAVQIITAIMNTAAAVISALATSGNIYAGIALSIMAAATGAAQIGIIASSKSPDYGDGSEDWRMGIGGVKHSDASGGNPVIDPRTGRTIARLEEKEAIIPADSAQANQPIIRALLKNRGRQLNVSRAMENISFANGTTSYSSKATGAINTQTNTYADSNSAILVEQNKEMIDLLKGMKDKKVILTKYDMDTFNERNDYAYQRTSLEK